jgi:hypothetical protein
LYVPLSERESKFTNPIDESWVPYIRGDYANEVVEDHAWVQDARRRELPLRSGPSGTAHRLLYALVNLGYDAAEARFAIAGFLGPIHAHSCHEILDATDGIGTCRYKPDDYELFAAPDELARVLFKIS